MIGTVIRIILLEMDVRLLRILSGMHHRTIHEDIRFID